MVSEIWRRILVDDFFSGDREGEHGVLPKPPPRQSSRSVGAAPEPASGEPRVARDQRQERTGKASPVCAAAGIELRCRCCRLALTAVKFLLLRQSCAYFLTSVDNVARLRQHKVTPYTTSALYLH